MTDPNIRRRTPKNVAAFLAVATLASLTAPAATPAQPGSAQATRSRHVARKHHKPRLLGVHVTQSPTQPGRHSTISVSFLERQRVYYTVSIVRDRYTTKFCHDNDERSIHGHPGHRVTLHFRPSRHGWCRGRWSALVENIRYGPDPCAQAGAGDYCRDGPPEYHHRLGRKRFRIR